MIAFRFYLISDRTRCGGRTLASALLQACRAGVRAVQIREKDLDTSELLALTRKVREELGECGSLVMVNSNLEVARSCGVQGIHLPEGSNPVRDQLPAGTLIARSTHSVKAALEAEADGVDFITFGPVYDTPSKASYGPAQGLRALAETVRAVTIPVFALGGVTPGRAGQCLEAGAHGVAAISAVLSQPDIPEAVGAFEKALGGL
jgi:thiamine-phosphate pyrophosphorylase